MFWWRLLPPITIEYMNFAVVRRVSIASEWVKGSTCLSPLRSGFASKCVFFEYTEKLLNCLGFLDCRLEDKGLKI